MKQYQVDEVACEEFTVRLTRHTIAEKEVTSAELLAKHLEPSETQPWDSIPQATVDSWAINMSNS